MKLLFFCFLLINSFAFCQIQTVKVRKELRQVELPSHVTLCGMYKGDVRLQELYNDNQLKISYNTLGLKIISYEIFFKTQGKINIYASKNDTISTEIRTKLLSCDLKTKVFIDDIKAVTKNQDTIYLNPITLRILE